jgi:hypothetical protein
VHSANSQWRSLGALNFKLDHQIRQQSAYRSARTTENASLKEHCHITFSAVMPVLPAHGGRHAAQAAAWGLLLSQEMLQLGGKWQAWTPVLVLLHHML